MRQKASLFEADFGRWFADVTILDTNSFLSESEATRDAMPACEDPRKAFGKASQRTCWMLLHRYTLAGYFGFAVHVSATCGMRCPWRTMNDHETAWTKRNRQVLHQAESVTVGGYELSQPCRSYRYAAEILDP